MDNPLTSSSGISHNFIWKVKTHLDITKENTHLTWTILGGQSGAFVRCSLNFKPFNSRIEQKPWPCWYFHVFVTSAVRIHLYVFVAISFVLCPCFNAMILIVGISPNRTLLRSAGTIQKQIFELPPSLCDPRSTFQPCFGV